MEKEYIIQMRLGEVEYLSFLMKISLGNKKIVKKTDADEFRTVVVRRPLFLSGTFFE